LWPEANSGRALLLQKVQQNRDKKLKLSLGEQAGGFARLSSPQREWEPSLKHFLGSFLMLSLKTNKMKNF